MLSIRAIRDPRAATRPARAARALDLLKAMSGELNVDPAIRWEGWELLHNKMIETFTPETLMGFKSHPDIAPQICGGNPDYLARVRGLYGQETLSFLMSIFRETLCGDPPDVTCVDGTYITRTSMRHIYYLAPIHRFCRGYFGRPVEFVEVGGGFGNLARLCIELNLAHRYNIIDFPASLCVQYYFLGEFFEEADIAVWTGERYLAGDDASRVRLVIPNGTEALGRRLASPSFLVSTMAMTEIPAAGQNYYLDRIKSSAIYITGQTVMDSFNQTQALGDYRELSNRSLFYRLAEMCHPVEFREGNYYSDFLGITL